MATNPSVVLLDTHQIVKRVYDSSNDSVRVNLGDINGLSFNLSATGDSIVTYPNSLTQKVSLTSASSGTVMGPISCVGMVNFNLYTNTTSTIVGAQQLTLQVSPSDTDNVWISTGLTITPSTTNGTVVMGTMANNIVARRCRVIIAATITSGTFDLYLDAQAI